LFQQQVGNSDKSYQSKRSPYTRRSRGKDKRDKTVDSSRVLKWLVIWTDDPGKVSSMTNSPDIRHATQ